MLLVYSLRLHGGEASEYVEYVGMADRGNLGVEEEFVHF